MNQIDSSTLQFIHYWFKCEITDKKLIRQQHRVVISGLDFLSNDNLLRGNFYFNSLNKMKNVERKEKQAYKGMSETSYRIKKSIKSGNMMLTQKDLQRTLTVLREIAYILETSNETFKAWKRELVKEYLLECHEYNKLSSIGGKMKEKRKKVANAIKWVKTHMNKSNQVEAP